MLVAVLASPLVAAGTIWLALGTHRPLLLVGVPFALAAFVDGLRTIARHSRRADHGDLVSGGGRGRLMVAAVLLLVVVLLPLGLLASTT